MAVEESGELTGGRPPRMGRGVAAWIHRFRSDIALSSVGIGRESPLGYTERSRGVALRIVGIGRESPLGYTTSDTAYCDSLLGLAGSRRLDTLVRGRSERSTGLGLAGSRRLDTLSMKSPNDPCGWDWPGVAAWIHFLSLLSIGPSVGIGRESPLGYTMDDETVNGRCVGIGRESPLGYTGVFGVPSGPRVGIGRESPLGYTE